MWTSLDTFNLNGDWHLSVPTSAKCFRIKHQWTNPYRYAATAIIALARGSEDGVEIYSPQKIYPKSELEIIQFPTPPLGWQYSFAVKQLVFNSNLIQWSLSVDMPLYPIIPDAVNPDSSTSFTSNTYQVTTTTASKILAANSTRKDFTIFNSDTKHTLCIDLVSTVTTNNPAFIIPPGQLYVSDIEWVGDVYAIAKGGTVNIIVREFT